MKITLETKRLILRPFRIEDAEEMFSGWASDIEVTKYLNWNPHENIEVTKMILNKWITEYEKPERLNFAITLKSNNALIGGIDVVGYIEGIPVIGYALSQKYWNQGYMTEACHCLINYLFSIGHDIIRIDAAIDNIGSNRVIQKCGGILFNQEMTHMPNKNCDFLINQYYVKK